MTGTYRRTLRVAAVAAFAAVAVMHAAAALADPRIDANVSPTSQFVSLNLDANRTDYEGSVTIELRVKSATSEFQFHAQDMTLDGVTLIGKSGAIEVTVSDDDEHGFRVATTATELQPGEYTLEISFHKEYNTQSIGLYRMVHEGQGYLFSQFEATDGRRAFPCWDEPSFKIPYQLSITVPMQQVAVTNTPLATQTIGADTKTFNFEKMPPTSSYLIAIAAGPLESVAIPELSIPGRIYTVKGQKHLAALSAEMAPPILAALEEYFGRPYPYKKLDLIAIPEFWPGAMENPGAVTYRDNILLIDKNAATMGQKRWLAYVHAHEFAHMWFGDLVTMSWWDDLWLNESFASWMGSKIAASIYPQYDIVLDQLGDVHRTMGQDARPSTTPIRKPIESTADMIEDVGLAYEKGRTILGMVEAWIGPDAFQQGVRDYVEKHAWGNTVAADLFTALSNASNTDVTPVLASFLDQAGLPIITASPGPGGVITISQKRFSNHGVDNVPQLWTVPVRLKYSDGKEIHNRLVVLDKESTRVEVGSDVEWVMPDAGAYGYYRWNAPSAVMFRIAQDPANTLTREEATRFIGNARALLNAGEIGGDEYLTVIGSFASDPQPHIMESILSDLNGVKGAFVTEDLESAFASYVRQMLRPVLDRYGMEPSEGEAEVIASLRPDLIRWLGIDGEDQAVVERCRELAEAYMKDPTSVDASLVSTSLSVSAVHGDRSLYDRYKSQFLSTKVPTDRGRYLGAMGSVPDEGARVDFLEFVLSDEVRPNEMFTGMRGTGRTKAQEMQVFHWMMENYDRITARFPEEMRGFMAYYAGGCSEEKLALAHKFFAEPAHGGESTERTLNKVTDQVTDCLNLREREGAAVADYLNSLASAR